MGEAKLLGGNRVVSVTVCDFAFIYVVWLYVRFGESVLERAFEFIHAVWCR